MSELKAKTLRELNEVCDDLAEVYCGTEFCVKQQQHLNQKYVTLEEAQKAIYDTQVLQQNLDKLECEKLEAEIERYKQNEKDQVLMKCEGCFANPAYAKHENKIFEAKIVEANKILDECDQLSGWGSVENQLMRLREVLAFNKPKETEKQP